MRAIITALLTAIAMSGCSTGTKVEEGGSTTTTTTTTIPSSSPAPTSAPVAIQAVSVSLSGGAGTTPCQVSPPGRSYAWADDVLRWTFIVQTDQCKSKKVKIKSRGDKVDCDTGQLLNKNVLLPLEHCERDDLATEDVIGSTLRITCSVKSNVTHACYKYTIAGQVVNGDPEIEIDRPRKDPSEPTPKEPFRKY